MQITAYPAIAAAASAHGLMQCYVLWLVLRAADAGRGGRGLFERSALWDAVSAVTAASASALFSAQNCAGGDVMSRMIAQGDGVFWRATRTHVALVSRRRVAMAWGIPARDGERAERTTLEALLTLLNMEPSRLPAPARDACHAWVVLAQGGQRVEISARQAPAVLAALQRIADGGHDTDGAEITTLNVELNSKEQNEHTV